MWSWMTMSKQRKEIQNYKISQRIMELSFKLKLTLKENFCYPSFSKPFPFLKDIDGNSMVKPLKTRVNKAGKYPLSIIILF